MPLGRKETPVADDAELDGIAAAMQFGHCSQKPILGRTVRLDGNVEGVVPVEGDDQRVSGLLLRRTELRPVRDGALGSCSGKSACHARRELRCKSEASSQGTLATPTWNSRRAQG